MSTTLLPCCCQEAHQQGSRSSLTVQVMPSAWIVGEGSVVCWLGLCQLHGCYTTCNSLSATMSSSRMLPTSYAGLSTVCSRA